MRDAVVLDLADCTEFRQVLEARAPKGVHAMAGLLVALLGAGLAWSALAEADLVVRAPGRVRPASPPEKVFNASRGDVLGGGAGARVVEVRVREGDEVRRGDLLIRLETGRLDNETAKQRRAIRAAEDELETLARQASLTALQVEATRARARAELDRAREQVRLEKQRRAAEVRLARAELEAAEDEESQLRALVHRQASPRADYLKAMRKAGEMREKLARAQLPADESPVPVAERALEQVDRDAAVAREGLERQRAAKLAEAEAARIELANRELERGLAEIRAPRDGVVIKGDVKVGDVLEPGKAVMELARRGGLVFEAAVPSEEVGHLRLGLPARIKLDVYDYQRYGTAGGRVAFLAPDSGVDPEKKTTTFVARIALDHDAVGRGASRGRVRLGMAGTVDIVTGRESLLSLLLKRIRQSISLG